MDMDRFIGRLLDNRYEILEVIGTGGMAVVYKARCHRLNRMVAVKILKDEYTRDEEFRQRFHAESHAVAMLSHPNIVSVYDVSTSDEADYIVMELIDGITLKQYMERKGVLNWKETLHFAIQIAKALEHAHSRGIIHRDIKPHNVMVLKNGSVKVMDFGIARVVSKSNTLTKEALGSVHYISPEQSKGGRVDNCSDLYSLGVVMYEMMTGRPPYDGESPVAVAIQHINGKPTMPSILNPNIPGGLEQIVMKAMAKETGERYQDAAAMLYDMDEFRKNPAILFDYNNPNADMDAALHMRPPVAEPPAAPAKTAAQRTVAAKTEPPQRQRQQPERPAPKQRRYREEIVEEPGERGSKVAAVAAIFCAVVAVVAIVIFAVAIMNGQSSGDMIRVPNLLGCYEEELASIVDLEIRIGDYKNSDQYEEGQVMEQTPSADTQIARGGRVTVTISRGKSTSGKTMENLVGVEQAHAENFLNGYSMGLNIMIRTETHTTIQAGCVTRTEPAMGDPLTNGQTVTLWISSGPDVVTRKVPNVVGRNVQTAVTILNASGFKNIRFEDVESTMDKDTVVRQSVQAQQEVDVNTEIVLQISLGSGSAGGTTIPVVDPDLVYKIVDIEIPETVTTPCTVSILFNNELQDSQEVLEGAVSIQFEVSGKGIMRFTVQFGDGIEQQIVVDFDE